MKLLTAGSREYEAFFARLRGRQGTMPAEVERSARAILESVKTRGDAALFEQAERFDGVRLDPSSVRVAPEEIRDAYAALAPASLEALKTAASRIRAFHSRQLRASWFSEEDGAIVGQLCRRLERVGIYVPGGTAAYPSTVIMCAIPAAIAGVPEIVMCTPVRRDGRVASAVLVAADLAGVSAIYKVGGVQAVAAMAYGTASIPKVDKIVGPGNVYVAAAKRLIFGQVGIDLIAGPTELLIIADEEARAAWAAADLLSQAEHDPLSSAVLLTPSQRLAEEVLDEVKRQVTTLPRRQIAEASLEAFGATVVVRDLDEAAELGNQLAPEHLELMVKDPWALLPRVKHAGAIFMGGTSPEVLGDYVAGPNHVLPTSGTARFASSLSVDDFQRRMSLIAFSRETFEALEPAMVELARLEGLEAHARAAMIRCEGRGAKCEVREEPTPHPARTMKPPRVLDLVKAEVRGLTAYRAEEPRPDLVKLDANESPFPLSERLRQDLLHSLERVEVNRYPDPKADRLRSVLATEHGVGPEQLVLGNGSDELIQVLLLAIGGPGATVLAPVPTFSMYELIARSQGLHFEGVPLGSRFEPDLPAMIEAIERTGPKVVFLATPNNPTGGIFSEAEILKILAAAPGLVVVDEAYGPYAGSTMLPHLVDQERLVILRSLSKIGLAGLRIGYIMTHPTLAAELEKVRLPFNVNAFSQVAAVVLLAHREWIDANVREALRERARVERRLVGLAGVEVFPSEANFILFRTRLPGVHVFEGLLAEGILVRNLGSVPGLSNCLRVTIGTAEENDRFLDGMTGVMTQYERCEGEMKKAEIG